MKKILLILLAVFFLGCETEITPDLEKAAEIIVIDAWIDRTLERQEIRITKSQPYFDNSFPTSISGAIVTVEELSTGTIYEFQEGTTNYYWDPSDTPFGNIGDSYKLSVTLNGETFEAQSHLGRVPPVDSIKFRYNEKDLLINGEYYSAEFLAEDPLGVGDTYWIKAWKNGVFLGKPAELNVVYDAAFTAGQGIDGQQFIIPIRRDFVTPFEENPEKENEFLPPYNVGDSLYVEIHSLDPLAYDFLFGVYYQISRPGGFAELFSTPLANSITNIKAKDENSTTDVAGFFNVAAVSSRGQKLTQEIADQAKKEAE